MELEIINKLFLELSQITTAKTAREFELEQQLKFTDIESAMDVLKKAFEKDPDYAYSWHCNVAMACYDTIMRRSEGISHERAHEISNDAASAFMRICFDVTTVHSLKRSPHHH